MVVSTLKLTPQDWVETIKRTNGYTLKQELPLSAHRTLMVFNTNDPDKQVTMILNSKGGLVSGTCYGWKDQGKLDEYIKEEVNLYAQRDKDKEARKQRMKESTNNVKVGDIFYATFGYEACFVDFFQIIEKKGSMIKIRENAKHHDYDGNMDGNCGYTCYTSAVKDSFCGETLTKRLFGEGFTHRSNHFHKWDGRPIYEYNDH